MCHALGVATQRIVHFTVGAGVIWALLFLGKSNIKDLVVMELQSFSGAVVAVIDIWIKKVYMDARVVLRSRVTEKVDDFSIFLFTSSFGTATAKHCPLKGIIRNLSNLREMDSLFLIKSSEV